MSTISKRDMRRLVTSRADWKVAFAVLHEQCGHDISTKALSMEVSHRAPHLAVCLTGHVQRLAQTVAAERVQVEQHLSRVAAVLPPEEARTDPPFVARAAIYVLLAQRLTRSTLGSIGRWGNNPTKQLQAAQEARHRLRELVEHVLHSASPSDAPDDRAKAGAQVMVSQLFEDLSLATGVELTVLRAQRTADFNVLAVLARGLQTHQFACENQAQRVSNALASLEGVCERLRLGETSAAGSVAAYRDNLSSELDLLSQILTETNRGIDRLEEAVQTMRWAMGRFVWAVQHDAAAEWSVEDVSGVRSARMDEDVRLWLQMNGLLVKFGRLFVAIPWRQMLNLSSAALKELGVGGSDAKRLAQLCAREDAYRAWDTVVCAGWLRKRGSVNTAWKRRFFVLLTNLELLYFKSDVAERPQDAVQLRRVSEVTLDGLVMQLHTATRLYEIMASDEAQCRAWCRLLRMLTH